jgi:hypothetical protein
MTNQPNARSVKISEDERTGWSSDRPRRGGGPPRPADVSARCRVLRPADQLRYSPGSLLVIVSPSPDARDHFASRLIQQRGVLLSLGKVRGLLAGRVPDEEIDARAAELLQAAVVKRLEAGDTVAIVAEGLSAEEREPFVRAAAGFRRPRHAILIEAGRDAVAEEDRDALNDLRRRLDAGLLGEEGFQTALRVSGDSVSELKRIDFQPPPRDD